MHADGVEKCEARLRDRGAARREIDMAQRHERVGKPDRDLAGEMIVADPRMPQLSVLRSGDDRFAPAGGMVSGGMVDLDRVVEETRLTRLADETRGRRSVCHE